MEGKMPKRPSLTEAQLKSLVLARLNMEQIKGEKQITRLQQERGIEVQEEKQADIVTKNKFMDLISDVLTRRLLQNSLTEPLFSSEDFNQLLPWMIGEFAESAGEVLNDEDRENIEKYMKRMFENFSEMVYAMVPPRVNPYEEYWRWVTTVLDLATERGVLPSELFALDGVLDEITRRMLSKEQFVTLSRQRLSILFDFDTHKKLVVMPMFDVIAADADEEERRELEREFEAVVMPQIRENLEKTKAILVTLLDDEVARIYTAV